MFVTAKYKQVSSTKEETVLKYPELSLNTKIGCKCFGSRDSTGARKQEIHGKISY